MTKLVTKLQPGGPVNENNSGETEVVDEIKKFVAKQSQPENASTQTEYDWLGLAKQAQQERDNRVQGYAPVTGTDNTGVLKGQYQQAQQAVKLVPKTEITKSGPAKIVPKTISTGGISVDPSATMAAGNYQNITALNAAQRRLLRKNGGQYIGRNGQVYTIGAGTSRAEMRRAVNQQRRDLAEYRKLRGLGLVEDTNDVFEAYSQNPNASYIRYNPEGFKKQQSQQSGGTATPSSLYLQFQWMD